MKRPYSINQFTFAIPEGSKCSQWRKYGKNRRIRIVFIDEKDGTTTVVLMVKLYVPHVLVIQALPMSENSIPEIIAELTKAQNHLKATKQEKG